MVIKTVINLPIFSPLINTGISLATTVWLLFLLYIIKWIKEWQDGMGRYA